RRPAVRSRPGAPASCRPSGVTFHPSLSLHRAGSDAGAPGMRRGKSSDSFTLPPVRPGFAQLRREAAANFMFCNTFVIKALQTIRSFKQKADHIGQDFASRMES